MFVRWIYKIWRAIWFTILTLLLVAVLGSGIALISLQQKPVKKFLAHRLENVFNANYQGKITIGELGGYLPFNIQVQNVKLTYPSADSLTRKQPIFQCDTISFSVNLWELLSRQIRVTSFNLRDPEIHFKSQDDSTYTIREALKRVKPGQRKPSLIFKDLNIYAPVISIKRGTVTIDRLHNVSDEILLPKPIKLDSLNMRVFLELNSDQRFLDIDRFDANVPQTIAGKIDITGQVFNDSRYLEFNQFKIKTSQSHLVLNGEVDGVDMYASKLSQQFHNARYKISVDSTEIYPSEFADIFPQIPLLTVPIKVNLRSEGDISQFNINKLDLVFDKSELNLYGKLNNLNSKKYFGYDLNVNKIHMLTEDLKMLTHNSLTNFKDWDNITAKGTVRGNIDSVDVKTDLKFPKGQIHINGSSSLKAPYVYKANLKSRDLTLDQFKTLDSTKGYLNIDASMKGQGLSLRNAAVNFTADLYDSKINDVTVNKMNMNVSIQNGFLEPSFTFYSGGSKLTGNGWIDLLGSEPIFKFDGSGEGVDLAEFFPKIGLSNTNLNFKFKTNLQGGSLDRLYGRASMDISRSIVGKDTLRPHQFYIDLNSPDKKQRSLRFTSSIMDFILQGHVEPSRLYQMGRYWTEYFKKHINSEIKFQAQDTSNFAVNSKVNVPSDTLNFGVSLQLKDVALLRHYFTKIPFIKTKGRLKANVKADSQRLLITGGLNDPTTDINKIRVNDSQLMITASFNHSQDFKQFANLDVSAKIDSLSMRDLSFAGLDMEFSMKNDSIKTSGNIGTIGKNASLKMKLAAEVLDTAIVLNVNQFNLGNNEYQWENKGKPGLIFDKSHKVNFQNFDFVNGTQKINLVGAFSSDKSDSVIYSLQNINLQRVSDLINGRINFEGTLNASFYTKSLSKLPQIQGNIFVDRFALDNRPVGDFKFHSKFNPVEKRFDTEISVKADTSKYHDYYVRNDSVATDIQMKGYFQPPDAAANADTLYDFNINFKQIDMWVLRYIIPGIFNKLEGPANGKGYIAGNTKNYNFHAHFNVDDVHAVPVFMNSNFYLTGPVDLDRYKGVTIDSVRIHDNQGGTGLLYGNVDLNNFQVRKKLNLTLDLNRLKFLNNDFNPDVPFYGDVIGTGEVRLTGSNLNPFLQTVTPLQTSSSSVLSIPLLDETSVQDQSKSIEFVKEFSTAGKKGTKSGSGTSQSQGQQKQAEQVSPSQESFTELFQLDLQFSAPDNSTVKFIFDPVTGEVLTAQGGGNVNITLQDQNLQMFGQFNITGGNYLFVGGGVFSRKFYLENGGNIIWEGDPKNPRINVTSVYRARPNIKPITNEDRRVPINLILKLTGNIKSVQNQFYFQFPNSPDVTQSSTILSLLNSEDQKLLQATSLLLTGSFSNVNIQNGSESQRLGTNLQSKVTQVGLSQLLSNQINTLLNSSLSDLNIDLNMTGFDQADLGIALRLFNDRLVLRREGVIGGGPQYDNIGDLGAEYQINPSLSVEVFHRQDPTLSSSYAVGTTTPLPSVNGVGLKYQVQFNTWKELPKKIARSIISIFKKKKKAKTNAPADTTTVKSQAEKRD